MEQEREVYTVSELTRAIKFVLEDDFPEVWVEGEISNFRVPNSGHAYFTLKDKDSQLKVVLFKLNKRLLKFEPEDGLHVIVRGRISVYEPRGEYQLIADYMEPKGIGALQLAFEQLKENLFKEGLFDEAHKIPIPQFPQKIAIITSATGAAIRDILRIIDRRFSNVHIIIYPVKVQGEGASVEIAQAIRELNALPEIDVMIVGRGGGSIEDLWAFNEEVVARAIYDSKIPVISAVGHEIDYTIADFVADLRAPTPSAAAEIVIARKEDLSGKLDSLIKDMRSFLDNAVSLYETRLAGILESRAFKYPFEMIERYEQEIDDLRRGGDSHFSHSVEIRMEKLNSLIGKLDALSPLAVLKRGYSITLRMPGGKALSDVKGIKTGDIIETRLAGGRLTSEVKQVAKEEIE